jgi:hypothetical protein
MFIQRLKYYIPWKISSSCMIFCGLSYYYETPNSNPNSSENQGNEISESPHKFDKCLNIYLRGIEWEINPKTRIRVYLLIYKFKKIFIKFLLN